MGDIGDQGMLGKIGPIGGKGKLWSGNFLVFSLKVNMCFVRVPGVEQYQITAVTNGLQLKLCIKIGDNS